jgi:hypothetical protein
MGRKLGLFMAFFMSYLKAVVEHYTRMVREQPQLGFDRRLKLF